jgi:hypothetical protein
MVIPAPKGAVHPVGASLQVIYVAMWAELLAFLICFFGRAKAIAPIAYCCIAGAYFWVMVIVIG